MNNIKYNLQFLIVQLRVLSYSGKVATLLTISLMVTSCEEYLKVDLPNSMIAKSNVFSDDITARSAVTGMYVNLLTAQSFSGGDLRSVAALTGLSSDELKYNGTTQSGLLYKEFEQNAIRPDNDIMLGLWKHMYFIIYQANAIIEGLEQSSGTTVAVRNQLTGEALFIRAFTHFYLTNLFGEIPLVTTTDYSRNRNITRTPSTDVYAQIEEDLKKAQELLGDLEVTSERIRPDRSAATALLARIYAFRQNWADAEAQATSLIANSNYAILSDLNTVFLANSKEAVWQLKPNVSVRNTNEGAIFILIGPPNSSRPYSLNTDLVNSFEPGDLRRVHWVGSRVSGGVTYYYPFKYKVRLGPGSSVPTPLTEYSMVLRLAEQYLIRAEARAQQGDLSGAMEDLDVIRARAGLALIRDSNPGIAREDLLRAIAHERRIELFSEWGHRWLDLKRTAQADVVLSPVKPSWDPHGMLYPIPQSEFDNNPNLGAQNPGY